MQIPYVLRAAGALLLAGLTFTTTDSQAQTIYVWDGSNGANWSTGANWLDGTVPADPGTGPDNIVGFDVNSETLSMIMDLSSGFDLSKIIVQNPAGDLLIQPVLNSSRTLDLIAATGDPVTIDMSAAEANLSFGTNGSGTLTLNVANSQTWDVAMGRTLSTVDVDGSTSRILTLTGGGAIVLGGASDNSNLRVSVTGAGTVLNLAKASSAAFHALGGNAVSTIDAGTIMRITGTGGDQVYYQHNLQVDGLFDLNGNSEGFDGLSSANGVTTGVITSNAAGNVTLRINEGGEGGAFGGVITDGSDGLGGIGVISLVKAHVGTQVFAGNNTYSGSTTLSRGILQLLGASGALSDTSSIAIDGGGELRLDSRSTSSGGFAAGVNNNRIADDADIELRAGTLSIYGVSTADVTERVGAISANFGYNVIRMSSDTVPEVAPALPTITGLTATSISRSAGTVVSIMGDNIATPASFGTTTSGIDGAYFRVLSGGVNASMLSGAGGTGVNRDILVGFFGSGSGTATTTANGSDFMTVESGGDGYDYLRPLLVSEYDTLTSGAYKETTALASAATSLNNSTAYNALKISGGNVSIGVGRTLFLGGHAADALSSTVTEGAGMLLLAGGTGISGGVSILGTVDFGSREMIIRSTGGTANIDARITGSGELLKTGNTTLQLNNANAFTGRVSVLDGILQVRNDKALGAAGGDVFVTAAGSNATTLLELAAGVNVTGENVILGASGGGIMGFRSGGSTASHNTWGGDVIASNVAQGGRSDSESSILVNNDASLTIYGRVYSAPGDTPTNNTYNGNDNNFTRRIGFSGSGGGVVNLFGIVSDTATGVAATAADRMRVNMSGNEELNVNIGNAMEVTGLLHLIQGYMRYEGTGNFFDSSTSTTDRVVLMDAGGTGSQVALLLTKDGQSFYRRGGGAADIQIGNSNDTTASNVIIGGENESGVVTFGNGNQRLDFVIQGGSADIGRFRDVRFHAREGGEVNIMMDIYDDTGFGVTNEIGAVTKTGLGTVRLTGRAGANNDIDGGAYALGGTLLLDYSTVTTNKIQSAAETTQGAQFTAAGGDLRLIKTTAGDAITERMAGNFTVRAGGSEISIDAATGATLTLRLATGTSSTITRQAGGTVNFVESGAGAKSIVLGLTANRNKRLGSYATYGTANNKATSWAFISDTTNDITGYTHTAGELNAFGTGLNTDLTLNAVLVGPTTTNSVRINDSAVTSVDLGTAQLTIEEGGVLIGSDHASALTISNGNLTAGAGNDLIIHNYGTGGLTIGANIIGGAVTFSGTGVTTLTGTNTYTGTTYLVGGTVSIAADSSLGNAANNLYFNGGELRTTETMTIARGVTVGGNAAYFETANAANTTTLIGVIARETNFIYTETNSSTGTIVKAGNSDNEGVGDIIKTGAGTLRLGNIGNTYAGVTDVKEGTLQVDYVDASGAQTVLGTSESWIDSTIVRSGATLTINKPGTSQIIPISEWFRMEDGATLNVTGGGRFSTSGLMEVQGALAINVAGASHFDQQGSGGYMFGDGDITKTGSGIYMLLGNNTLFTGSITVLEGVFGARGQGMVTGSDFTEVITVGGTNTTAEFRRLSNNEFTNNQLVENHNIVVTGTTTGSQTKSIGYGNNSVPLGDDFVDFNGTITLLTNTVLNVNTAGGTRSQTAYLRFNGAFSGTGNATTNVSGGSSSGGTFTRTAVYELNADNSAWAGSLTVGAGTNNVLNQHVVRFGSNDALKSDNAVILRHNSTLQAGGRTVTAGNLSTLAAATTDVIENAAHADGTLAFTQTTNGNWDATFRDGTPIGTVYEEEGNTNVGKLNIAKEGNAVATLTLDNLYTGSTTVNAGTLQVGSGGTAALRAAGDTGTGATTSVLRVNSGGRVAGTGTVQGIAGTTTHFVTGIISPGDVTTALSDPTGIGTLDVIGNLNVSGGTIQLQAGGSTFNDATLAGLEAGSAAYNSHITSNAAVWDGVATGTSRGNHDLLNISGQLSLDGDSTVSVTFTGYNPAAGDVFDLLDWLGVLGGAGFDVGTNFRTGGNGGGDLYLPTLAANLAYDVSQFSNNGLIAVVTMVVPEPSRALLFVAGAASLLLRRRRRGRWSDGMVE